MEVKRGLEPMRYLPRITLGLWGALAAGYLLVPQVILSDFLLYPLVVLLSIFLPVSFWLSVRAGRKPLALVLAAIVVVDAALLVLALERNFSAWKDLERHAARGIVPAVAELLAGEKDIGKSQLAARSIFQHHYIAVPYNRGDGGFAVYAPSDQDKQIFRQHFAQGVDRDVARMHAEAQLLTTFLLLALHVGIVVLMLLFLPISEEKAARPAATTAAG